MQMMSKEFQDEVNMNCSVRVKDEALRYRGMNERGTGGKKATRQIGQRGLSQSRSESQ